MCVRRKYECIYIQHSVRLLNLCMAQMCRYTGYLLSLLYAIGNLVCRDSVCAQRLCVTVVTFCSHFDVQYSLRRRKTQHSFKNSFLFIQLAESQLHVTPLNDEGYAETARPRKPFYVIDNRNTQAIVVS